MPWLNDVATVITGTVYQTSASNPPVGSTTVQVIDGAGSTFGETHNGGRMGAPTAVVIARGADADAAYGAAAAAFAKFPIYNTVVGSTTYRWMRAINEVHDIGVDDSGRARYSFTVLGNY